jgi:hypothetical protein
MQFAHALIRDTAQFFGSACTLGQSRDHSARALQ